MTKVEEVRSWPRTYDAQIDHCDDGSMVLKILYEGKEVSRATVPGEGRPFSGSDTAGSDILFRGAERAIVMSLIDSGALEVSGLEPITKGLNSDVRNGESVVPLLRRG